MPATTEGKITALKALEERRKVNKGIKRVNNSLLPAGSPMYFYCITCGEEMMEPEGYTTRSTICIECSALKELDWLE